MLKETVRGALRGARAAARRTRPRPVAREIGRVVEVAGGVVTASGLSSVRMSELVEVGGRMGMVIGLAEKTAGIAMLASSSGISAGDRVARTGRLNDVPVGRGLLGRVVNPLGEPIDGGPEIEAAERYDIERPAPPIIERAAVAAPLVTGIKAIDAVIPIGRGQRELILGDRQTGKTAIALDAMLAQKDTGVICVYCAIGGRTDSVARVVDVLRRKGCMKHTVVMAAGGEEEPGLLYIAPYAATSIAEYFMERHKKDVLIVYDNLTAHAQAYRQLSLTLRRPMGREAYPGDIFYIHSRLLERATHLKRGGSITALPVCETQAENISAYIPTNLISITDGQIFLTGALFAKGVIPAVDIGVSVSRVGSKAQLPAYKAVAGDMKISYSQFEELEAFAKFGTQLDEATRSSLARGERIRETLKQPALEPIPAGLQVVAICAVNSGALDDVPLERIAPLHSELLARASRELRAELSGIDSGAPLAAGTRRDIEKLAARVAAKYRKG
ncbi:MAG: F0F1 ATP synthase subunit alpha [Rickettsiales bacterium]|nr:F0F1 ATP synthase subunit alpha [Rickettsiales bacterium]